MRKHAVREANSRHLSLFTGYYIGSVPLAAVPLWTPDRVPKTEFEPHNYKSSTGTVNDADSSLRGEFRVVIANPYLAAR